MTSLEKEFALSDRDGSDLIEDDFLETAAGLLDCAVQDFHAALSFVDADPRYIKDHIFCGHLQGCVEKMVKAVLKAADLLYPHNHDIRNLFGLLRNHGRRVPVVFAPLAELTIYATKARYGVKLHHQSVDRVWLLNLVRDFAAWLVPDVGLS